MEQQGTVTKIWRFYVNRISDYTRRSVEADLIQLFPDIARKGLKLRMWYIDELAGEVSKCIIDKLMHKLFLL